MKAIIKCLEDIKRYALLSAKRVLNIEEAALLTGQTADTLRRKVAAGKIPAHRPFGKSLYFDRAELEECMLHGRIGTQEEAEQAAAREILMRKGGKK